MSNGVDVSATGLTKGSEPPVAHPLAVELARVLAARTPVAVLLLGAGSGRNIPVFLGSGVTVDVLEQDPERARHAKTGLDGAALRVTQGSYAGPYRFTTVFGGALSTHALLHGRRSEIVGAVAAIEASLAAGGLLYATFGSTHDPRYGTGRRLEGQTFAPLRGRERGVPHVYFDEGDVRSLLANFDIEGLAEHSAAETAGHWAHSSEEMQTLVHWFVRASKRCSARFRN